MQPPNEFSLYVGDLPHDCSEEKLQGLFRPEFKSIKRVQGKHINYIYINQYLYISLIYVTNTPQNYTHSIGNSHQERGWHQQGVWVHQI